MDGRAFNFTKLKMNTVETMKPFLDKVADFEILPRDSYTILEDLLIKNN